MSRNPFDDLLPAPATMMDTYRFATVTSTGPLRIRLDGDTDPVESTPVALCAPTIGARVWVQLHGRQLIVLGIVTPA